MSNSVSDEFTLIVTVPIQPGKENEYLEILHPVLDVMRHETTFISPDVSGGAKNGSPALLVRMGRTSLQTAEEDLSSSSV